MLEYDRIDVSEGINVSNVNNGILKILVLSMSDIFAMVAMI